MTRAIVYVDGFNLYYRMLRNTPHKWLNISSYFEEAAVANNLILNKIYYFTADVKGNPSDPSAPLRQMAYLRALSTLPNVTIIKGYFMRKKKFASLVAGGSAEIWHTEEKGSDVNIATQMLIDAHSNNLDVACLVSNDTDLVYPVKVLSKQFGKKVLLLSPVSNPSPQLTKAATQQFRLDALDLAKHQFPSSLQDKRGIVTKPGSW